MRKYIGIGILACLGVACSPAKYQAAKLKAEKDSLNTVKTEIMDRILAIDAELEKLDTTKKLQVVTTTMVQNVNFEHFFNIHGTIEVAENALVFPQAGGRILKIHVSEGSMVKRGQKIASLDAEVMNNTIAEVNTQLSLAKDAFEKQERLWNKKIGSEMQYLQAKTNYESLVKKLKTLQTQKDQFSVVAPFDGVVDEIFPKVGEMAAPQMQFCRVINLDQVYIKADVSEDYIDVIKEGTKVKVNFPSLEKEMEASISRVGNFINKGNRTFKVRINIANEGHVLKPNLLADLSIRDYFEENAPVVPTRLIQQDKTNQEFIYGLDKENKVYRINVKTGKSQDNQTIILEGLGEEVHTLVDKGAKSVQSGETVEIKE